MATPAQAQLRAVSDGAAPILAGDRVLWGQRSGEIMHVVAAPLSGGAPVPFGDVPVRRSDDVWLAASPAQVAVQLRDSSSPSAPGAAVRGRARRRVPAAGRRRGRGAVRSAVAAAVGHGGRRVHAGGGAAAARCRGTQDRRGPAARGLPRLRRGRRLRRRRVHRRRADRLRPALRHRAAPDLARGATTRRSRASPSRRPATLRRPWPSGTARTFCCGRPRGLLACARSRAKCGWSRWRPRAGGWPTWVRTASTRGCGSRSSTARPGGRCSAAR